MNVSRFPAVVEHDAEISVPVPQGVISHKALDRGIINEVRLCTCDQMRQVPQVLYELDVKLPVIIAGRGNTGAYEQDPWIGADPLAANSQDPIRQRQR